MNIVSVSHFTSCYYFGPFNIYYTQKNSAFLTCKLWGRITPLSKNPTEPFLVINCVTCNCLGHSRRDSFCQKLARYCTGKWFSPYEYELWLSEGQRPKSSQKRCFFEKNAIFLVLGLWMPQIVFIRRKSSTSTISGRFLTKIVSVIYVLDNYRAHSWRPKIARLGFLKVE